MNKLTKKEAGLISDLLTYEEQATKKARLYSRISTDKELAETYSAIADDHQKRFNELLNLL